ncbi:DUF5077 domain-containing protein [Prosthecobacter fluviatilis]|uniref:DUF5077 domain-containing protein n=1 Tax=Prosthecobacter fluviatilis TaxID=445931 RepID=A0ABW0KPG6_9BACT
MTRHPLSHAAGALALLLALNSCGKQEQPPAASAPAAAAPAPVAAKPAAPAPPPAPAKPAEPVFSATPVDLNGFGSDDPVLRADEPKRGVIVISPQDLKHTTQQHWDQYDCTSFNPKRWGRYEVRVTYTLRSTTLGTQFRFAQQPLKKTLTATSQPKCAIYGTVYVEKPMTYPFSIFTAATGSGEPGFEVHEIAFVPAPEGPSPVQAADGSIVLEAASATTWAENMRYEPKSEKNCLGFWTSEDDFAEWDFEVTKPGRYKVTVVHGCGTGNEGSQVAVKVGAQELKFTVKDTGGFQKWAEESVGEVDIKAPGKMRLVIDPVSKAKSAVLDVSKVVLKPVS